MIRDSVENGSDTFSQPERQAWITSYILEQGSVLVDELAERFNVSRMTIHRDLDDLEKQGVLRKVRNGATAQQSSLFESDVRYRLTRQKKEKEAIARIALSFIEPGQAIVLDESTTLLPLVKLLPSVGPLTVITNFLPILNELKTVPSIHLITLAGEYQPRFDTFSGLLTEESMNNLQADCYFTSTTAVYEAHAYHPDQQVVIVKRAMMARTIRHYMLLDHTKFAKTALHHVAPLTAFDSVIVDEGLEESQIDKLCSRGVQVAVARY